MCFCILLIGVSKFKVVDKKGFLIDKIKNYCLGVIYGFYDICVYIKCEYEKNYV